MTNLPDLAFNNKVPLTASLPAYLKDPANYKRVQKELLDAGATRHSHGEMVEWAGCVPCQRKLRDRVEMMKKLGFKSPAQYMAWYRTHEQILSLKRDPLPKYNTKI